MATKRRGNRFTRKKRGGTNTKWAIVQYDDRRMTNVDNALTERNKYYANKWGHDYILRTEGYDDMPPYWRKVFLVKEVLNTGKYKGVLWLDTDAVVYNLEIDINTLVEEGKHMYFSTDIAQAPDSFCAGVWFVLNTTIGKEIMEKWVEKYDKSAWRKNNKWRTDNEWAGVKYEQGAFNKYLIATYEPHLKHLDKNLINALSPEKGTFICHFYFGKEKRKNFINANPLPKNNVKGGTRRRSKTPRRMYYR